MKIPFLDLSIKDMKLKAELLAAVETVLDHGRFIHGLATSSPPHHQSRTSLRWL